jgi:hypothetical protein
MSDENAVTLTMSGSKLSYSDDITVAQAAQIISYLHGGIGLTSLASPPQAVAGSDGPAVSERRRTGLTPRDALEAAGAKTNPEKIVAFALYVEQQGGKETFTIEDIKPLFRQARESVPANLSRDLDAAVRSSWVAAAEDKGEYFVTEVAAGVLDSGFDSIRSRGGVAAKAAKATSSRRPRRTAIPMPDAFKGIEVSPTLDGYIDYHKVSTVTDKYLWAINAAKVWGVEALTPSETAWLTDRLGAGIPQNDLTGYYTRQQKKGHVNKNAEGKVRVTPRGTEYLAGLGNGA